MDDIIQEKDKILSFTLFKVEKGREKICNCNPPHYEIDTTNRIVICKDCGATIDPFEALISICGYNDKMKEYQEKAIERARTYAEWADKEHRRRMKNKAFKDMDVQYQNGLYPYCPKCGKMFDPAKLTHWGNKGFVDRIEDC